MSKKRSRAARANMANLHRDANQLLKLNAALDNLIERKHQEMNDAMEFLPIIGRRMPSLFGFGLSALFGTQLLDPMSLAGISSVETGRIRSDGEAGLPTDRLKDVHEDLRVIKRGGKTEPFLPALDGGFPHDELTIWGTGRINKEGTERVTGMNRAFGERYGVPPLFAERDNGHRQSADELEALQKLIAENTYVVPQSTPDKWGAPTWPEGTPMVSGRHADAGQWGKLCYRTACQKPNAFFFNKGTYKHYCQVCADVIDRENMSGAKLHHLARYEGAEA